MILACLHEAISHELYSIRHAPRCTPAGNYDEVQCDDERCFCVDQLSGVEIPNTWVPEGNQPNCKAIKGASCSILNCLTSCPLGHNVDSNGCPICECKNSCAEVHCPQGQICIAAEVSCFTKSNCARQPRCVQNVCQGHPLVSSNGMVEDCTDSCSNEGYWCNNIGHPTAGGICCPEIISTNGQQIIQAKNEIHLGKCPIVMISVEFLATSPSCKARCHSD